jgi:release factor glutamine methyltransferase
MALSLGEVLRRSTTYLAQANLPTPRLDAELLMAHSLGLIRLDLYIQFDRPLDEAELARLRELLRERVRGRPVAYLLGQKEFYGLPFLVDPGVLIPRPETELLVQLGLERMGSSPGLGADLGCGSGCIGIALLASAPLLQIDAVDIEPAAVELTRQNAAANHVAGRTEVFQGDWTAPLSGRGLYQLIVSNPPYVSSQECRDLEPTVRDFEPRTSLDGGADGLDAYKRLLPGIAAIAAPGATVLLEGDPRRMELLLELCRSQWPQAELCSHRDLAGHERVLKVQLG